jgi:hypothetical protein
MSTKQAPLKHVMDNHHSEIDYSTCRPGKNSLLHPLAARRSAEFNVELNISA